MPALRTAVGLLLALFADGRVQAADNSDFKPFTSTGGKFSISFPGTPNEATSMLKSPFGDLEMHTFKATRNKEREVYSLTFNDIPAEQVKNIEPEKFFDLAQQGGIAVTHGRLSKRPKTTKSDNSPPSRDLEIEIDGTTTYSRMILVGNRFYVIMAYPDGSKGSTERAKTFLDSFKSAKGDGATSRK